MPWAEVGHAGASGGWPAPAIVYRQQSVMHWIHPLVCTKLLANCRQLVGHFKHSNVASHALQERKRQEGTTHPLGLISKVAIRWNSTFDMLQRLGKLHIAITAVLSDSAVTKSANQSLNLSS